MTTVNKVQMQKYKLGTELQVKTYRNGNGYGSNDTADELTLLMQMLMHVKVKSSSNVGREPMTQRLDCHALND